MVARRKLAAGCTAIVWLTLSAPVWADAASAGLVHLQITQPRSEGGAPIDMEFTETDRTDSTSMVTVRYVAGGSVVSAMWTLRGMCAVARARGKAGFRAQRLPESTGRFKLIFVAPDPSDPPSAAGSSTDRVISMRECTLLHF